LGHSEVLGISPEVTTDRRSVRIAQKIVVARGHDVVVVVVGSDFNRYSAHEVRIKSIAGTRIVVNALPRLPVVKAQSLPALVGHVARDGAVMRAGIDNDAATGSDIVNGVVFDRDIVGKVVNVDAVDNVAGGRAVVAADHGVDNIVADGVIVRRIVAAPSVNTAAIVHIYHRVLYLIALNGDAGAIEANAHVANIHYGVVADGAARVAVDEPDAARVKIARKVWAMQAESHARVRDAVVGKCTVAHVCEDGPLIVAVRDAVVLNIVAASADEHRLEIMTERAVLNNIIVCSTHQPDTFLGIMLELEVLEDVV